MMKRTVAGLVAAVFALGLTSAVSAQPPGAKSSDTMEKKAEKAPAEKKMVKKPAKKPAKKPGDKTTEQKMEKPAEAKK
jgi:hypothetical protein